MGWKIIAATILRLARGFVESGMKIQATNTAQKNARPLREQRSTGFYGPLRVTFPAGCDGRKPSIALITKPFNSAQTIPSRSAASTFRGCDGVGFFELDTGR